MYNRLFKYLPENNLLYCKQFGFQTGHSPEHAIFQLVEQINQLLREKCPNTELFLVRIFLYSVQIQENTEQK